MTVSSPEQQGRQSSASATPGSLQPGVEDSVSHTLVAVDRDTEQQSARDHRALFESGGSSDSNSSEFSSLMKKTFATRAQGQSSVQGKAVIGPTMTKTVVFIVLLGVLVAMVMIGVVHFDQCPAIDDLPLTLLTSAVALGLRLAVLLSQWMISSKCLCRHTSSAQARRQALVGHCLEMTCFLLLVFESLKVYRRYGSVDFVDHGARDYCHPALYLFSFWLLNVMYGAGLVALLAVLCVTCCGCCFGISL